MTSPSTDPPRDEQPEPQIVPPESVPPLSAEELVDGERPARETEEEVRRYPSTIGGAFYLLVLVVVAVGMVLVATADWRTGIRVIGGGLLFAALVRVALRAKDAGMLAVRHKALDAALLVGLGSALIFLAGSIPDQPGL